MCKQHAYHVLGKVHGRRDKPHPSSCTTPTPLLLSLYPPLSTCSQNGGTHTPCFRVHAVQAPTLYMPPQPPPLHPLSPIACVPPPLPMCSVGRLRRMGGCATCA